MRHAAGAHFDLLSAIGAGDGGAETHAPQQAAQDEDAQHGGEHPRLHQVVPRGAAKAVKRSRSAGQPGKSQDTEKLSKAGFYGLTTKYKEEYADRSTVSAINLEKPLAINLKRVYLGAIGEDEGRS